MQFRQVIRAKRVNLIENKEFDLSDSESEETSPEPAKKEV